MFFLGIKQKLKAAVQKWRDQAKRRLLIQQRKGTSQGSRTLDNKENQHTMTHASPAPAAALGSHSHALPPSILAGPSSGNQHAPGTETPVAVINEINSEANPISLHDTTTSLEPGSAPGSPVGLTTETSDNPSGLHPLLSTLETMDTGNAEMAHIQDQWRIANALLEELNHDGAALPRWSPLQQGSTAEKGAALIDYRRHLESRKCACCQAPLKLNAIDLIERTISMLRETRMLHPYFLCRACGTWTCIGGDRYYDSEYIPALEHAISAKNCRAAWCCDQGSLFLIFSLLCGPEFPPSSALMGLPTRAPKIVASSSGAAAQPKATAAGSWHTVLPKGTGYGPHSSSVSKVDNKVARGCQLGDDGADDVQLYFQVLARLWPSNTKEWAKIDPLFQDALLAMLSRSPMLHHASELLRHAAIEEMNSRLGPLNAVLDFVESVGHHVESCRILLCPHPFFPLEEQLACFVLADTRNPKTAGSEKHEKAQPLAAIVEHLAVPCRKFLEAARKSGNTMATQNDKALFTAVQRICALADGVNSLRGQLIVEETLESREQLRSAFQRLLTTNAATRRMRATADKDAEATAAQDLSKRRSEWHRANCVKEVPDDLIIGASHFKDKALATATSKPAPGRMRKLLAQVSSLSTDLPEGIYVRHGESRIDVLKIIIIGPPDTPYEHGIFEFDMFCSSEFPRKPPQMFFRTTGGGQARFNPNLYSNGRICLSLLGTWQGQPWEPDNSTILQILVSIQAMIFNEEPYYNEPGHEHQANPQRARQYNRNIELLTLRDAVLPWLTSRLGPPPKRRSTASGSGPLVSAATHRHEDVKGDSVSPKNQITNSAQPTSTPPGNPSTSPPTTTAKPQDSDAKTESKEDPIWGDVVRKHFEFNARAIRETAQKWEKLAEGSSTQAGVTALARKIGNLINAHRFGD